MKFNTLKEIYEKYPFIERLSKKECAVLTVEILMFIMKASFKDEQEKENILDESILGALKEASYLKDKDK